MKTIRFKILTTALTVLAYSCCSEPRRYPLRELDKLMIPYQIGDIVRYVDDKGLPVTLVATEILDKWVPGEDDELTGNLRDLTEHRTVVLRSENEEILCIGVSGRKRGAEGSVRVWGLGLHFNFWIIYDSKGGFIVDTQYNYEHFVRKFLTYDSVLINNLFYYDVAMHEERGFVRLDSDLIYYNKTHGVLQLRENEKKLFTLDTVIFAGAR